MVSRSTQRAAAEPEGGTPRFPLTERRMGTPQDGEAQKMRAFLCALPNEVKGSARAVWEALEANGGRVDLDFLKRSLILDMDEYSFVGGRPGIKKKDEVLHAIFANGEMQEFKSMEGLLRTPDKELEWRYRGTSKMGTQEMVREACSRLADVETRNALFYGLAGARKIFGNADAGMDFNGRLSALLRLMQMVGMSGPGGKIDVVAKVAEIFRMKAGLVEAAVVLDGCILAMQKEGVEGLGIHLERMRVAYGE